MTFKQIPGYPNYEINEDGVVRNINKQRVLKPYVCNTGYQRVSLPGQQFLVHHLVLLTFVGERPSGLNIRHLDGNQLNNSLSNLSYGSQSENLQDRKLHGTWGSKLNERKVRIIRGLSKCGFTNKRLTEIFTVSFNQIRRVLRYETWQHIA